MNYVSHKLAVSLAITIACATISQAKTYSSTTTMADETRLIVQLLENVHFNGKELDKDDLEQLIPDYMKELDTHSACSLWQAT